MLAHAATVGREIVLVVMVKGQRRFHDQQLWAEEEGLLVVMVKGQRRLTISTVRPRKRSSELSECR